MRSVRRVTETPHSLTTALTTFSESLAEVCLPSILTSSFLLPRSSSAIDSSLHTAPHPSPPVLITPANFYTPPSPHSICISPASAAPATSSDGVFECDASRLFSALSTHPGVASEKALALLVHLVG